METTKLDYIPPYLWRDPHFIEREISQVVPLCMPNEEKRYIYIKSKRLFFKIWFDLYATW